jgi:Protein of unknown function (DUF4239)
VAHDILVLPTWLIGVLLVVVVPGAVLLLQWGIRRRWPALAVGEHNDVVGFIIAVVGVIYAVLLGFVVIVSWEGFNSAESIVDQEASTLRSIYRGSAAFPRKRSRRSRAWSGSTRGRSSPGSGRRWPRPSRETPAWVRSSTS